MTFPDYLALCNQAAYSEPESPLHTKDLIPKVVDLFLKVSELVPPAKILDIGSGNGEALAQFESHGFAAHDKATGHDMLIGLNLLKEDQRRVIDRGYSCLRGDMHDLGRIFFRSEFDAVVARHILEHSPAPGYVLAQIHDLLKPGGWLYVEVPCAGTVAFHQANRSHLSCLHDLAWEQLMIRGGFAIHALNAIDVHLDRGEDRYLSFITRKV